LLILNSGWSLSLQRFVPEIKSAVLVKEISPTQSIWTLHYHLTPPISDRIFTVLQTIHLEGGENGTPREGWVFSVPIDLSEDSELKVKEEKGVKGRYCSVELIKEGPEGVVEWTYVSLFSWLKGWVNADIVFRMATSSTPGGSIPSFIAERSMPSQIYKVCMATFSCTTSPFLTLSSRMSHTSCIGLNT